MFHRLPTLLFVQYLKEMTPRYFFLGLAMAFVGLLLSSCGSKKDSGSISLGNSGATPSAIVEGGNSSIEFVLSLSPEEKQKRIKIIESLPRFSQAAKAISQFGFHVDSYATAPGARAYPNEESLTGLGFIGEASQQLGDHKFKVVFMGPTGDRLDTIRFQAWGVQTRQAREQLYGWASKTLTLLEKGAFPELLLRKYYGGENVGDDGVSNGFCRIQFLQRPINPSRPSVDDRISLDLIFDKEEGQ